MSNEQQIVIEKPKPDTARQTVDFEKRRQSKTESNFKERPNTIRTDSDALLNSENEPKITQMTRDSFHEEKETMRTTKVK